MFVVLQTSRVLFDFVACPFVRVSDDGIYLQTFTSILLGWFNPS